MGGWEGSWEIGQVPLCQIVDDHTVKFYHKLPSLFLNIQSILLPLDSEIMRTGDVGNGLESSETFVVIVLINPLFLPLMSQEDVFALNQQQSELEGLLEVLWFVLSCPCHCQQSFSFDWQKSEIQLQQTNIPFHSCTFSIVFRCFACAYQKPGRTETTRSSSWCIDCRSLARTAAQKRRSCCNLSRFGSCRSCHLDMRPSRVMSLGAWWPGHPKTGSWFLQ